MIEWTIPETITVGFVLVFAIGLIYKFLGQRTDPKLLELISTLTEASTKRDENRDKNDERQSQAWDRNTEILGAIEKAIVSFAQTVEELVSQDKANSAQLAAIGEVSVAIMPAINEITQQLEVQKGSVQQMDDKVGGQNDAIQQILAAMLRVEGRIETIAQSFETLQADSKKLGNEIEETKQEITSIKGDVTKLKTVEKPQGEEKQNAESNE
jgi:methyl-accepting chemotaxis protein